MSTQTIKRITPEIKSEVTGILTIGFATCPLLRWIYAEPQRYVEHFPGFIKYYCGDVYSNQTGAFYSDGLKGALLWNTADDHRDDGELMSFLLSTATESKRKEIEKVFKLFNQYHPAEPYWYYTVMGIDPMHQKQGLGDELFRYGLDFCDRAGAYAYCEATSPHAARLYERMGWKVLDTVQVGSSPIFFPMLRAPH